MPTLDKKLSTLIESQLPEFIRSDYTTFTAFVKAYYEFLEQQQGSQELIQNILSYNDIDSTLNSFINYFLDQYCATIPRELQSDKKLLLKYIKDIYDSKGSERSYLLLLRLLLNKQAQIFYPSTQILKASDGKWERTTSIFVKTLPGVTQNPNTIPGNIVTVIAGDTRAPLYVIKKKPVYGIDTDTTSKEVILSEDTFEFIIDDSKNINVNAGDIIEYQGYRGRVLPVPFKATIVNGYGGTGFKVGDIINLVSGDGRNAKAKVKKVTSTGSIVNLELISFGINYNADFYVFLSSITSNGNITPPAFSTSAGAISINESSSGFVDEGYINQHTYSINAVEATYQGEIVRSFSTDSRLFTGSGSTSDAQILVTIGSKAKYPGYYKTNDGFLSDDIFLEDQDYYQPYSYVIKIEEDITKYKQALLDLLHPAGTKLFGEYQLNNSFSLNIAITSALQFLTSKIFDTFSTSDSVAFSFSSNIQNVDDNIILLEDIAKTFTFSTSSPYFQDLVNNLDSTSVNPTLNKSDSVTNSDSANLNSTLNFSDNQTSNDSSELTININKSDEISFSQSGNIEMQGYVDNMFYFANDDGMYIGSRTPFMIEISFDETVHALQDLNSVITKTLDPENLTVLDNYSSTFTVGVEDSYSVDDSSNSTITINPSNNLDIEETLTTQSEFTRNLSEEVNIVENYENDTTIYTSNNINVSDSVESTIDLNASDNLDLDDDFESTLS